MALINGLRNIIYKGTTNAPGRYNAPGGNIVAITADTTTLLIGDAVYVTSGGVVTKSTTAANYQTAAGIVVGGTSTGMLIGTTAADVGTTAATSGQTALVQTNGLCYGVGDGTVARGALVSVGTSTAGRLEDTTVAVTGQIIGIAMEAGTTGAAMLTLITLK